VLQNKEAGLFSKGGNKIAKVPMTAQEALTSDLMGILEKNRFQKFLEVVQAFEVSNPSTHQGIHWVTLRH
jgi:Rab GDP dissociation inhibitor